MQTYLSSKLYQSEGGSPVRALLPEQINDNVSSGTCYKLSKIIGKNAGLSQVEDIGSYKKSRCPVVFNNNNGVIDP